jgi:integrase
MATGRPTAEPRLILRKVKGRAPVYVIAWNDGQRKSTRTGSRREADQIFARWLLDHRDEQAGLRASPRYPNEVAIGDLLAAFADDRGPEVRFADRIGYAIKRLNAWWGDRNVDAVLPATCKAYRDTRLKQGVKLATITKELGVLRAALKWGQTNGRLISIPTVVTPPKQDGKDRWLTRNEAARLLRAARAEPKGRQHLPLFILIALYTGARSEAILTLKWFPQVNLERGVIDFNPPGRARTTKGRAVIPLPAKLRWFLAKARARSDGAATVLSYQGEPIKRIIKGFRAACRRAGLDDVTPHTLRHTCATWQAQHGVDLRQIAGWLGHSDMRTTELYAHHHPDYLQDALAAVERRGERKQNKPKSGI